MMVMVLAENWYSFTWQIAGNWRVALLASKTKAGRGGLCIEEIGF
jgi:hypothetical protein